MSDFKIVSDDGLPSLHFSWMPDWVNKHIGTCFTREYYEDYELRKAEADKLERYLYENFGDIGLGEKKPDVPYCVTFGLGGISNALGCDLRFSDAAWPQVLPMNLSLSEAIKLKCNNPASTYPISEMLRQATEIKDKYGKCAGEVAHIGSLVIALDVRGSDFLLDFYDNPADAKKLLHICAETFVECIKTIRKITGYNGVVVPGNCPLAMLSGQNYKDFVQPFDIWLSKQFETFGLHHCGNQNQTIAGLAEVPNVSYVDIGVQTDIKLVRKYWGTNKRLNFTSFDIRDKSEDVVIGEIIGLLKGVGEPYGRLSLGVSVDRFVTDERIRAAYKAFKEFSKDGVTAM